MRCHDCGVNSSGEPCACGPLCPDCDEVARTPTAFSRYVLDESGDGTAEPYPVDLSEFFEVNEHLEDWEIAKLLALRVGESFTGDEGAGGRWTIKRVADALVDEAGAA